MFTGFFYLLRKRGLEISATEWLALLEGLQKGLHGSSFGGFYYLCRAVLVKSEADFDRFDQAFLEYFKDVPFSGALPDIAPELMHWLENPSDQLEQPEYSWDQISHYTMEEMIRKFQERMEEQDSEHNGGKYWIATQGRSQFGNNGWHPNGLRVGGVSRHQTAMMVAGERKFRDFRRDNTLDTRQFQLAFRLLRQMSVAADQSERELDLDGTIQETCDHGGMLHVRQRPPRKNAIKLLLLMDSGGSMDVHAQLCSQLFQAATQSNYFKELHTYYFHNCVYENLYTEPGLSYLDQVSTEWVMNQFDSDYRVILVGDARMNDMELWGRQYNWVTRTSGDSGMEWLKRLQAQYPRLVWLNPYPTPQSAGYWNRTHIEIAERIPMYQLTVDGLEEAMRRLLVRR